MTLLAYYIIHLNWSLSYTYVRSVILQDFNFQRVSAAFYQTAINYRTEQQCYRFLRSPECLRASALILSPLESVCVRLCVRAEFTAEFTESSLALVNAKAVGRASFCSAVTFDECEGRFFRQPSPTPLGHGR